MLNDFYVMLPELYGTTSCTLNAHCLTHLTKYVRQWGPLWNQSLFGFESWNGHMTAMLHSKRKVAEQLSLSMDICHTIGCLSNQLNESENEEVLKFLSPMSDIVIKRRNMRNIQPGIYSIGSHQLKSLTDHEKTLIKDVTGVDTSEALTFKKLYFKDTILYSGTNEGKRDSSFCCYFKDETKHYGMIQKFSFSPPAVFVEPFKPTSSSLLKNAGNPGRELLRKYAEIDLLSAFIVEVEKKPLPVCVINISDLLYKCVRIACKDHPHSYVIQIPNNFEHH